VRVQANVLGHVLFEYEAEILGAAHAINFNLQCSTQTRVINAPK
jgi:hypothetical protein